LWKLHIAVDEHARLEWVRSWLSLGWIKPKTMELVFDASQLGIQLLDAWKLYLRTFSLFQQFNNQHLRKEGYVGIGLWCLMPLSTILQLHHGGEGNQRKTQTCQKSLIDFYHIKLYQVHLTMYGIWTHNFSGDGHLLHRQL
jgi:hypothetical protein